MDEFEFHEGIPPRDGKFYLVRGKQFASGFAIVRWDGKENWWVMDDGLSTEVPMYGKEPIGWTTHLDALSLSANENKV